MDDVLHPVKEGSYRWYAPDKIRAYAAQRTKRNEIDLDALNSIRSIILDDDPPARQTTTIAPREQSISEQAIRRFLDCVSRGVQQRSNFKHTRPADAFRSDLPLDGDEGDAC